MSEPTDAQLADLLNSLGRDDENLTRTVHLSAGQCLGLRFAGQRLEALSDENANLDAACKMRDRENERLRALNAEMREALREFNRIAQEDEHRGDDLLWTTVWQETVEKARAILAKSESPTLPEKES
jgi:hypothetical protein